MQLTDSDAAQVHYPLEAIQSVPFSESKLQLLEAQVKNLNNHNLPCIFCSIISKLRYLLQQLFLFLL